MRASRCSRAIRSGSEANLSGSVLRNSMFQGTVANLADFSGSDLVIAGGKVSSLAAGEVKSIVVDLASVVVQGLEPASYQLGVRIVSADFEGGR